MAWSIKHITKDSLINKNNRIKMKQKETLENKRNTNTNLIYTGVLLLLFLIITIFFFYSTNFIIHNINKIFTISIEKNTQPFDIAKYSLVEKKLNLPLNIEKQDPVPVTSWAGEETLSLETENENILKIEKIEEIDIPTINKESILVNILNGARKEGVARAMSKNLESAGFTNIAVGDSKTMYPITTLFIKKDSKDLTLSIEEIVKKTYPSATKIGRASCWGSVYIWVVAG